MSSKAKTEMRQSNKDLLERLISESKSASTASKLRKINKVCVDLVEVGITPTIVLVVKHLKQEAVKINKQTIYNKRTGGNPYRELIDAWIEYSCISFQEKKIDVAKLPKTDVLGDEDLDKINDPVLRYRVSLLVGENKGLRNQLNIAREITKLPAIHLTPTVHEIGSVEPQKIVLGSYEFDVLNEFIKGNTGLKFDENGTLVAIRPIRKDTMLSSPGFREALEKLLISHTARLANKNQDDG